MFKPRFSRTTARLQDDHSGLWSVHNEALGRKEAGEDIILMSVGDPDLPTIDPIIEHAVTSLYRGRTHYSPGMGELHLRQRIADIETTAAGKPTSADEVIIFPGATNAVFTVLSCLLDPEDELIMTTPSYVGYEGIFSVVGARVTAVPTRPDFTLDVDAIVNRAEAVDTVIKGLLARPLRAEAGRKR